MSRNTHKYEYKKVKENFRRRRRQNKEKGKPYENIQLTPKSEDKESITKPTEKAKKEMKKYGINDDLDTGTWLRKMKSEDKEIEEIMENAGKIIFLKIMEKRKDMQEKGYKPRTLIIWEEYYHGLLHCPELRYSSHPPTKADTIVGLKIITTFLPDVLEVY